MNCEKCKNKKATVFYADEGGFRHSLCASCASLLGKEYSPITTDGAEEKVFIPETSLTLISQRPLPVFSSYAHVESERGALQCSFCGTELSRVIEKGCVGCPECYAIFGPVIFPSTLTPEEAQGARMPSGRRASIDRNRSISELKTKIRIAIESENYELAADLRDRIKALQARTPYKK